MNFVILAHPRTGSTMLKSVLSEHLNTICLGEIFHAYKVSLSEELIKKNHPQRNEALQKYNNWFNGKIETKKRNNNITGYFNLLKDINSYKQNFGFKLLYKHITYYEKKYNFSFINFLIKNNFKIIFIDRKNSFLTNLSYQKAKKTGRYKLAHKYAKSSHERELLYKARNVKFKFNIQKYNYFKNVLKPSYNAYNEKLINNGADFIKVYYEDLTGSDKIQEFTKLLIFLNEKILVTTESTSTIKQNVYTIEEQLKNYAEVCEVLKNDEHFLAAKKADEERVALLNK